MSSSIPPNPLTKVLLMVDGQHIQIKLQLNVRNID